MLINQFKQKKKTKLLCHVFTHLPVCLQDLTCGRISMWKNREWAEEEPLIFCAVPGTGTDLEIKRGMLGLSESMGSLRAIQILFLLIIVYKSPVCGLCLQ